MKTSWPWGRWLLNLCFVAAGVFKKVITTFGESGTPYTTKRSNVDISLFTWVKVPRAGWNILCFFCDLSHTSTLLWSHIASASGHQRSVARMLLFRTCWGARHNVRTNRNFRRTLYSFYIWLLTRRITKNGDDQDRMISIHENFKLDLKETSKITVAENNYKIRNLIRFSGRQNNHDEK